MAVVNVPWLGDFEHHQNKYLLGDVQLGHLPTPAKNGLEPPNFDVEDSAEGKVARNRCLLVVPSGQTTPLQPS